MVLRVVNSHFSVEIDGEAASGRKVGVPDFVLRPHARGRAEAVRQQLIGMGISGDRLDAQGYGSQYPVADNATEAGRTQNRRVDIILLRHPAASQ